MGGGGGGGVHAFELNCMVACCVAMKGAETEFSIKLVHRMRDSRSSLTCPAESILSRRHSLIQYGILHGS